MRTLKPNETQIQKALVNLHRLAGLAGTLLAHIPNGEKRAIATASKLKAMGVLPGMPDLLCGSPSHGIFFLELKRPGGRTSTAQKETQELLRTFGVEVLTADSLNDAIVILAERGVIGNEIKI